MRNDQELHQSVLQILSGHRGHGKAIKGSEIARLLGFKDDRQVRLVIRDLIAELYPIASSVQQPQGYFLIETREEANIYLQSLRNRLIEDAIRRRDFKRGAGSKLDLAAQRRLI